MQATIRSCTCKHAFQDKTHGIGKRVMNPCKKGNAVRCTVCNAEYNVDKSTTK